MFIKQFNIDKMNEIYKTKIQVEGERAYQDILTFVETISSKGFRYGHGSMYFMDKERDSVVRMNLWNKTVELSDKVEEWVFNTINDLNKKD